jgi:hypothetical protein
VEKPFRWLLLAVLLVPSLPAAAQQAQSAPAERPKKSPPPPLFPKHRRGVYTNANNVEVIDATPQSPPLETDDPSVPDKGEYEINLLTDADLGQDGRSVNVVTVDANYGVILKGWGHELPTQIKFEFPVTAHRDGDHPQNIGIGTSAFGLKFNFYNDESRGLRISVYPQIEFSTAGSVEKGVAEPGQTLVVPVLVSHESRYVTFVGNAGVNQPYHDADRHTMVDLGFGVGRAFFRKLAVMGDIRTSTGTNFRSDRLLSVGAGAIYGVRNAIWYGRVGHTVMSDDGGHLFLGFGMKVLIDTAGKRP